MKSDTSYTRNLPDTLPGLLILQQDLTTRLSHSGLFFPPSCSEAGSLRKQNEELKKQLFYLTVQMERLRLMGSREDEDF